MRVPAVRTVALSAPRAFYQASSLLVNPLLTISAPMSIPSTYTLARRFALLYPIKYPINPHKEKKIACPLGSERKAVPYIFLVRSGLGGKQGRMWRKSTELEARLIRIVQSLFEHLRNALQGRAPAAEGCLTLLSNLCVGSFLFCLLSSIVSWSSR